MNIKRAFLAAIAVLMLPGMAMAQSSTFPGSFTFDPLGPDVAFNLSLNCTGGTPLMQDINVKQDVVINFSVAGAAGSTCNFALDGVPAGWTATADAACTDIAAVDGVLPACVFTITPDDFVFSADIVWLGGSAPGLDPEGVVDLMCADVWDGTAVTTVEQTITVTTSGLVTLAGTYAPHPDLMSTMCSAEVVAADSALEVDDSACAPFLVVPGDGPDVECSITATVFFEGIPTLSQYGMAIMVLLMLGVGFVGFRRFV